jgi:glyoxylase-like metal-dependent hydrolase (beta-lactamase superfamily II)
MLETRAMTPAETSAINDSVFVVKDRFVNAYIFKGKQSYLMVDAGFGQGNFNSELSKLGIAPEKITSILLTHTDSDHTGSIGLFTNPKIYLHKDEEQMINGQTAKMGPFKTKWKYGPYLLFGSNDTLNIDGLKIRIIHTPGHTPGSVCFVINDDYLLTGDNLVVVNGKAEHFVDKFNMNTLQQIESIRALPDLKSFKYILMAHHGIIKN